MFKASIKQNSKFLVPYLQGIKLYNHDDVVSNVGTMMIINEDGTLLTCKHIAEEIINKSSDDRNLSLIHWFFEIKREESFHIIFHPVLDLAIIKFDNVKFEIDTYPKFSTNLPEQGQSVCKLGYAFPNIDFFEYNKDNNMISIKENASLELPLFPMDGIVTRHINLDTGTNIYNNVWFETSSPGLKGQSGGPIFGPDGLVYGIQSFTVHMDLDFNINKLLKNEKGIQELPVNSFMNLGVGISSVEIINFLEENNIQYYSDNGSVRE